MYLTVYDEGEGNAYDFLSHMGIPSHSAYLLAIKGIGQLGLQSEVA
jgi:hypothetical protein